MKKFIPAFVAVIILSASTFTASASVRSEAMGGSNPRPQAMGGSNPRPQIYGSMYAAVLAYSVSNEIGFWVQA